MEMETATLTPTPNPAGNTKASPQAFARHVPDTPIAGPDSVSVLLLIRRVCQPPALDRRKLPMQTFNSVRTGQEIWESH